MVVCSFQLDTDKYVNFESYVLETLKSQHRKDLGSRKETCQRAVHSQEHPYMR